MLLLAMPAEVSYRHCVEKEDLVQLMFTTYKSDAYRQKRQQKQQQEAAAATTAARSSATAANADWQLEPFDMRRWLHMAVFLKAEAGEVTEGRSPSVVTALSTAAGLAVQNDDEVYGCLFWLECCEGNQRWREAVSVG